MESGDGGERFAPGLGIHARAAAAVDSGSAFGDYARDDDANDGSRALLESGVVASSTSTHASNSDSSVSTGSSRPLPLSEPYDRYKSIELRAECYRRGARPTRSGPNANDNKAGYVMLLRAHDLTQNPDEAAKKREPDRSQQQVIDTSKKRRVPPCYDSNPRDPSNRSSETTVASAIAAPQNANTAKRRARFASSAASDDDGEEESSFLRASLITRPASAAVSSSSPVMHPAMTFIPCDQQLATEYIRLKMQILLESREAERASRREDQRARLHAELQSVIATLAQLHRLAKEYALAHDAELLADVNQDIAYFQEQRRKIKLDVELFGRSR